MKRIVTVQDLINELMLVVNKEAEINVTVAGDDYETEYTPYLYDFRSLILPMSILMMGRRKIGLFYKCIVNKAKDENSKII